MSTKNITQTIQQFKMPRYEELPNSGLYLEQISIYINTVLQPLEGISITPSMISNYVKKGLINKPVKKLYYAEHISHLFAITLLKHVLSLENILLLFEMQSKIYPDDVAYDYFCSEFENILFYVYGLKDSVGTVGFTSSQEKTLLRNAIISLTHIIHLNDFFQSMRT